MISSGKLSAARARRTARPRKFSLLAAACALCLLCQAAAVVRAQATRGADAGAAAAAKTYEFTGGLWFDGRGFRPQTFYTAGGRLTKKRPKRIDETVDLRGGYVVPPFGEAHNHNVDGSYNIDQIVAMYLREGVFYVKNPNNAPRLAAEIKPKLNRPDSIDVVFSNAGLTAAGGHPMPLYDELNKGPYKPLGLATLEGEAYFLINSADDLSAKWPRFVASGPDFVKTYLLYSEEFAKRKDNPKNGSKGLDPALLRLIVRRAHAASLRVTTHVETAADFHHALSAGVDEINHLPGYSFERGAAATPYQISDEDARLAARRGVFVVTTTVITKGRYAKDPERLKLVQENQRRNLRLLHSRGVRLAIGSDSFGTTSLVEAMNLHDLKVFDNLSLLKMWCETTAETIFPGRRVGRLRDGYEASFLVLEGDPLADFARVKNIKLRVKQGRLLK